MILKVVRTTEVMAPDGATHYGGDLLQDPTFYKCTQVGVGGDHWWWYGRLSHEWKLAGHSKPHFIAEIPKEFYETV